MMKQSKHHDHPKPVLSLKQMMEISSNYAQMAMCATGEVYPVFHVQTVDEFFMIPTPPGSMRDRPTLLKGIRQVLADIDVINVVFINEAWCTDARTEAESQAIDSWLDQHGSLAEFPGRSEEVVLHGEDSSGAFMSGHRTIIRRGAHTQLGPLELETAQEVRGRFVGFLPPRGTMQ
jgi:hypothetical protein